MTGKTANIEHAREPSAADSKRERSTIAFPYGDVDDALAIAKAIHGNAGLSCTMDQLAAYMKQTPTSGAFRLNVATARTFGVIENEKGEVNLTDLGRKIVDPNQETRAKVEAFLTVPLYRAIYEKFKGHMLPPAKAVEREMVSLGVSAKQADRARQAFERSAQSAGFYAQGKDRLVLPAFPPGTLRVDPPRSADRQDSPGRGFGNGGGGDELPPFIRGLLQRLPEADVEWSLADRVKWLQAAAHIFGLMYKPAAGDQGDVKVHLAGDIALAADGPR